MTVFFAGIATGDRVVVPDGDALHVAEVTGGYEWSHGAANGLCHTRAVRWVGQMHRSRLARPVHLQDPRTVFGLRGETAPSGVG
jgi:predicted Mrr-cat superfamily restriction endonuclease